MTVAPVATNVPSSDSGDGITVTVYNASQFSLIVPVPKGLTYVPGTVNVTGGDATTSGNVAATYCTAPVSRCLHRPDRQRQLQDRVPVPRDLPEPRHHRHRW